MCLWLTLALIVKTKDQTRPNHETVNVFPNPLDVEFITVELLEYEAKAQYNYTLASIEGKVLSNGNLNSKTSQLSLDNRAGVYLLSISKNDTIVSIEKVIKL